MPAGNVTSKLKKRIKYKANLQAVHFGIFSNFPIAAMLTSSTLSESLLCEYTLWTLSTPNQQSIWFGYFRRQSDAEILGTWGWNKDSKTHIFHVKLKKAVDQHNSLVCIIKSYW